MDTSNGLQYENLIRSRVKYEPPTEERNMAQVILNAFRMHLNRVLLVDAESGRQFTGAELAELVGRLATGLVKQVGLRPGDVVLTRCEHSINEILMALAVVLAGGALFASQPRDGYHETKTLCELVQADLLVTDSNLQEAAYALKANVAGLDNVPIVWVDLNVKTSANLIDMNGNYEPNNNNNYCANGAGKEYQFAELLAGEHDECLLDGLATRSIEPNQILSYMLTSGSTGRPKMVPSTHDELVHGLYSMISANRNAVGSAEGLANGHSLPLMPINKESILAGDLPLDHGAGLNTTFLSIRNGSKLIIMPCYEEETFWQAVNDFRITASISSTTFCHLLMKRLKELIDTKQTDRWNLDCFKFIACTGSKLTFTELVKDVNKFYTQMVIIQCYGCTEIGFISMPQVSDSKDYLNSTGHIFPGIVAKVVDRDTQKPVEIGQRGELLLWARSKFKGYRCHPAEDAARIFADCHDESGQFYRTGDQVHFDQDGRLYIHGRFKDTLWLREDWKILPAELEELIDQHPLVESSAVIGIPDKVLTGCHNPKAFVKLVSSKSLKFNELLDENLRSMIIFKQLDKIEASIAQFVAERTADAKHLRGGVQIVDEFPRVGLLNKIDRKALRLMTA